MLKYLGTHCLKNDQLYNVFRGGVRFIIISNEKSSFFLQNDHFSSIWSGNSCLFWQVGSTCVWAFKNRCWRNMSFQPKKTKVKWRFFDVLHQNLATPLMAFWCFYQHAANPINYRPNGNLQKRREVLPKWQNFIRKT